MAVDSVQSFSSLLRGGADPAGLGMLAALLAISGWYCLRSQVSSGPALPGRPPVDRPRRFYLLLCMLAAPLLMFAGLTYGLALLQQAHPGVPAQAAWKYYRALVWLLYGIIGLQQLFALQRMGLQLGPRRRRFMPLAASALVLLPAAMALSLLALDRVYFGGAGMPPASWAGAAAASGAGIVLWLLAQAPGRTRERGKARRTAREPGLASAAEQDRREPSLAGDAPAPAALTPAEEMALRLQEISQLLEQEKNEEHKQQEVLLASSMQQKVSEQKFLFESGLPCNLGALVHGLVILDQALDLRDHVRGDTLLHAAVREGNAALAQYLVENGADVNTVNWAGLTARATTRDAELQEILDATVRREK